MHCVRFVLSNGARQPTRATDGSAGWDIYSPCKQIVPTGTTRKLITGLRIEMPPGIYSKLYGRSGMATEGLVFPTVGVIDNDYRGELGVMIYNPLATDRFIDPGDKIGQLVFARYEAVEWIEATELSPTTRGVNGFGSTGR